MRYYIGPERRTTGERRRTLVEGYSLPGRRQRRDRRQSALAGVVAGLSADDLLVLRSLWESRERLRAFNSRMAESA